MIQNHVNDRPIIDLDAALSELRLFCDMNATLNFHIKQNILSADGVRNFFDKPGGDDFPDTVFNNFFGSRALRNVLGIRDVGIRVAH